MSRLRRSASSPASSDEAYYEARDRAKGRCIDGVGSARFWTRVKLEIARRQDIAIGLAGADMRA